MMDQHSKLSWRLHLIARALEVNQIPTAGVAYIASEDEWQSLVHEIQETARTPKFNGPVIDITYRGITVLKPKGLP